MFLKPVWAWCLMLGSPLLCVAAARENSEAHNGPTFSAFPGQKGQFGQDGQDQHAHTLTLMQSQSGALVVEPRAYPADPAPPRPYGFDYIDPLASISRTTDGIGVTKSSGSSATSVIETSATLSGSSQEARQTQSSASTLTDATKSDLKSEESTSINAPLPGLKTSAALPIGGTLQARPASSTSTITTGTSTGCGDNGQCLGSVSVATPAVVDVPSSTASGDGGGWTSTIGFWTSSWHKCFKDATGTECDHGVLCGDYHTVVYMHRRPNDGTLPCLITTDIIYLNSHTNDNGGGNGCILNFANLYRWPIVRAMQSSPTAYKELELFIITTTLYRRPHDRALSTVGSTTPSPTSTIMTSSSLGLCTQGVMSGLCIINGTAGLSTLGPPLTSVNTSQAAIATSNSSSASTLPLPWCTGGVMEGPCIVSGTAGTSTLSTSLSPKNATSSVAPTKVSSLPSPLPFCTGGLMSSSCLVSGTAGFSTSLVSPVEGTSSGAGPVTTNTTATSNKPPARSSASEAQPLCTGGEMSGPCVVSESVTISPQPSTATSSALNSTEFTTAGPTTSAESLPASSSRLASENSLPVCTGGEMSGPCIVSGTAGPAISTPSVLPATTAVISSTQPGNTATELSDISTSLTLPWCTGGLMIGPCISSGSLGISTLTPTTSPIWTNATTTAEATSSTFPICSGGDMGGSCVVTGTAGSVLTFSPGPSTSTVGDPISVPETSTPIPAASPTSNNTSLAALPGPSSIALPVCVEGVMSGPCIVVGTAGLSISTPGVTAAVPTAAQCSQGHLSPSSPPTNHTGPSSGYPPKTTSSLYGPTATIQSTAATSNSTSSSFEIGTSLADALRGSLAQTSAWAADQTDSIGSSPRTTTTTEIATVFADPPESPSSSSSSADMPGWSGSTTNWETISALTASRSISMAMNGGRLGPGYPPMGHDLERWHQ
ncbi:hypothetical protein PgNI_10781 [Pyricularia grisea]|uniref:Uncharacterized protein n=1 Tax=Pyricularia grisea TaxID=148305 RepID=A0A6P8AZP3_PYRGI|nr:hypothetical protein PgNI_10781 [Pyricularia grisea]TLD07805.1 hypothetical protein PgNI_10781 [Pyricularia grisea]